jgi:hypothetical protein
MPTFTQIGSVTVGAGGAASIDFTSIPNTYTDLYVKLSGRSTATSTSRGFFLTFNSSATGYSDKSIRGSGSSVVSITNNGGGTKIYLGEITAADGTASTFGNAEIYIPNYAGSTNKSVSVDSVQEHNATEAYATLVAGLWSNTSAISSISFTTTNNFAQYSTATLYGIKNS